MSVTNQNKRKREPAVYTVPELAARLKVSNQHILSAIDAGEINALNIGLRNKNFYRIPISEAVRYEAARSTLKGSAK